MRALVLEYYLLNSIELNLRIRRSSRRKSPSNAGSLIVVSQTAQICRNVHMATRSTSKLYSSTSTSTNASEAITIYTTNYRRLWLLRHILGIPSVQTMILNRRRKFIGNFSNDENIYCCRPYFSVMTFNMCFKCVLILVFFRSPKKLTMAQLRHLEIGIDATAVTDPGW